MSENSSSSGLTSRFGMIFNNVLLLCASAYVLGTGTEKVCKDRFY